MKNKFNFEKKVIKKIYLKNVQLSFFNIFERMVYNTLTGKSEIESIEGTGAYNVGVLLHKERNKNELALLNEKITELLLGYPADFINQGYGKKLKDMEDYTNKDGEKTLQAYYSLNATSKNKLDIFDKNRNVVIKESSPFISGSTVAICISLSPIIEEKDIMLESGKSVKKTIIRAQIYINGIQHINNNNVMSDTKDGFDDYSETESLDDEVPF